MGCFLVKILDHLHQPKWQFLFHFQVISQFESQYRLEEISTALLKILEWKGHIEGLRPAPELDWARDLLNPFVWEINRCCPKKSLNSLLYLQFTTTYSLSDVFRKNQSAVFCKLIIVYLLLKINIWLAGLSPRKFNFLGLLVDVNWKNKYSIMSGWWLHQNLSVTRSDSLSCLFVWVFLVFFLKGLYFFF